MSFAAENVDTEFCIKRELKESCSMKRGKTDPSLENNDTKRLLLVPTKLANDEFATSHNGLLS